MPETKIVLNCFLWFDFIILFGAELMILILHPVKNRSLCQVCALHAWKRLCYAARAQHVWKELSALSDRNLGT